MGGGRGGADLRGQGRRRGRPVFGGGGRGTRGRGARGRGRQLAVDLAVELGDAVLVLVAPAAAAAAGLREGSLVTSLCNMFQCVIRVLSTHLLITWWGYLS